MYRVVIYPEAQQQIAALPHEALTALAELLAAIELTPWNGPPHHEDNPNGAVRRWPFGPGHAGHVLYLILELPEQREVHVLLVQWLG